MVVTYLSWKETNWREVSLTVFGRCSVLSTIITHADLHLLIRQGYVYIKCNIKILGNVRKALSLSREIHSSSLNPGNVHPEKSFFIVVKVPII